MIWLLPALMVAVVVFALVVVAVDTWSSPRDTARELWEVDLYAVHRHFKAAEVKEALRRDAARAQRELDDELNGLNKRWKMRPAWTGTAHGYWR